MADSIIRSQSSASNESTDSQGLCSRSISLKLNDPLLIDGADVGNDTSPLEFENEVKEIADLSDVDFDDEQKTDPVEKKSKDLSDVSDEEIGSPKKRSGTELITNSEMQDLRLKLEEKKVTGLPMNVNGKESNLINDEDALDFEAEEGECNDIKDVIIEHTVS